MRNVPANLSRIEVLQWGYRARCHDDLGTCIPRVEESL